LTRDIDLPLFVAPNDARVLAIEVERRFLYCYLRRQPLCNENVLAYETFAWSENDTLRHAMIYDSPTVIEEIAKWLKSKSLKPSVISGLNLKEQKAVD